MQFPSIKQDLEDRLGKKAYVHRFVMPHPAHARVPGAECVATALGELLRRMHHGHMAAPNAGKPGCVMMDGDRSLNNNVCRAFNGRSFPEWCKVRFLLLCSGGCVSADTFAAAMDAHA